MNFHAFLSVLACAAIATGCMRTVVFQERFRIPGTEDATTRRDAAACVVACRPLFDAAPRRYAECLTGCPGVEAVPDAPCNDSEPLSREWCYEFTEERYEPDEAANRAVVELIGQILVAAVKTAEAAENAHGQHRSRGSRHGRRRHGG